MKCPIRLRSLLAAGFVSAAATIAPLATATGDTAAAARNAYDVPAGNRLYLTGHATGVQIYRCNAMTTGDGTTYAWGLLAPRATLLDDHGRLVATHFAGPTWRGADGSTVVGKRVDGATVDTTAIPWLLLAGVDWTSGADGDRLIHTTYIQRINTTGGLPPAAATCDQAAAAAATVVEVPYTADYTFWRKSNA